MKKIIKHKLLFQNGCSKNLLLWEMSDTNKGVVYEIIEEFKGHSITRSMLRGIYKDRLKALGEFKKMVTSDSMSKSKTTSLGQMAFS